MISGNSLTSASSEFKRVTLELSLLQPERAAYNFRRRFSLEDVVHPQIKCVGPRNFLNPVVDKTRISQEQPTGNICKGTSTVFKYAV